MGNIFFVQVSHALNQLFEIIPGNFLCESLDFNKLIYLSPFSQL